LLAHDPVANRVLEDFMGYFVGKSYLEFPELSRRHPVHGEIEYSQRLLSSYTEEGHLVHVRTSPRFTDNQPERFLVITADIDEGTISEWWPEKCSVKGSGGQLETEVILNTKPSESSTEAAELVFTGEPAVDLLQSIRDAKAKKRIETRKARLILTSQGCWFKPIDGAELSLTPLSELITKLGKYQTS
jgi:hypothetical protein